jgi:nicotinamide-nucleotide amidase
VAAVHPWSIGPLWQCGIHRLPTVLKAVLLSSAIPAEEALVTDDELEGLARDIGDVIKETEVTVGVAESLTGGMLVGQLAKVEGSGQWLKGGVVAYARSVKYGLLGVSCDKVVSEQAAIEMAAAARRLLAADIAVAVTGVGGPDPQDGEPPGTVWIATDNGEGPRVASLDLEGNPEEICASACEAALKLLATALRRS